MEILDIALLIIMMVYGAASSAWLESWDEERMYVRIPVGLAVATPFLALCYYMFTVTGVI